MLLVVAAAALIAVLASPRYLAEELESGSIRAVDAPRYHALLLFFVAGLLLAPLCDSLGLMWIAIEGATVGSVLLVGMARTTSAIEASWKYLLIGSVGLGFALLATMLVYASSVPALGETSDALSWSQLEALGPSLDPMLLRLAFVFALVGYGTKVGLVPFHTWLPDAHSQAPSPVSALLSGASLNVALYALVRFHLISTAGLGEDFSAGLLVLFGLGSLALALPFIVTQGDVKRLLAYSSIENMGLLTVAIGFGGKVALAGFALIMIVHALTKSVLFIAAGFLAQDAGTRRIARMRGSLKASPVDGTAFLVGILVLGGLPPSGMFVGELAIVMGGFARGWGLAAAATAVLLGLAFAGMLFHAGTISFGLPPKSRTCDQVRAAGMRYCIGTPLALAAILGVWTPPALGELMDAVVQTMSGTHV